MPFANVEDADWEVMFRVFAWRPLSITVEVPVPETLKPDEMVEVEFAPVMFKKPDMVEVAVVDDVFR